MKFGVIARVGAQEQNAGDLPYALLAIGVHHTMLLWQRHGRETTYVYRNEPL